MNNKKIDVRYHEPIPSKVKQLHTVYEWLSKYHRHELVGVDHLPKEGRILLVVNHGLATYDMGMLANKLRRATGRLMRGLSDRSLFYNKQVGIYLGQTGSVPARPHVAEYLLEREELVMVAPGGMREALKPSSEKYTLRWETRKGFVRLAIKMQTPIVLVACPAADDMFTVYENRLTKIIYQRLRLPVATIRGLGLSLIPRPVKLTHYLSEPIQPPKVDVEDEDAFNEAVDTWHAELVVKMENMLQQH